MEIALRHGWLKIPGVQGGERTLAEQLRALRPALAEASGKWVLDLGCAEGLIGLEFAKAGAARVLGIEREAAHLAVARRLCTGAGYLIKLKQFNLKQADPARPLAYDIVLALGIIHKLELPERGLRWAARSARELLLLRSGRGSVNGIIRGKFSRVACDAAAVLRDEGLLLEKTVDGAAWRDEPVEYWRRTCAG